MLKIAICDDIKEICEEIKLYIEDYYQKNPSDEVYIHTFYSGESLIAEINEMIKYDIIILDIELQLMNGVEVGNIIRKQLHDYITKIIYISSKNNYDRQLFDIQPFNFLEKPINKDKLIENIKLIEKLIKSQNDFFEFKNNREHMKIYYKDILYFEASGRAINIVCTDKEHIFYGKLKELKEKLPKIFIQPHRSYILNYDFIKHFKYEELTMFNNVKIPISRDKRKEIRDIHIKFEQIGV